jgi:hypothetical protein
MEYVIRSAAVSKKAASSPASASVKKLIVSAASKSNPASASTLLDAVQAMAA